MSGFAIARSHNLHFLDPSEENVISYWLPSSPLFLLRLPFCVFHCRHQSSRAQTRLHVHVRARHFLATFPRRINARSCAGVSKEPTFSLNGHDPPPFCRERKSILSLSSQSFRSLFDAPNTAPILSRFKTIKTHSPRVEISIEISEGGQTFVPFCVVHDRSIVE